MVVMVQVMHMDHRTVSTINPITMNCKQFKITICSLLWAVSLHDNLVLHILQCLYVCTELFSLINYHIISRIGLIFNIFLISFQPFFEPHFLQTQQFGDPNADQIGDDNSNSSASRRRLPDDDDDMDDDDDENDADSTNLPLNLVATQFAE